MNGQEVFVVVLHDRHTDDVITVHLSIESANAEIERFKLDYARHGRRHTWIEQDYGRDDGWVRYVDTDHDDGPNARIERTNIKVNA